MTDPAPRPGNSTRAERQAGNTALHADHVETGFWDDHGRPAPWPDDIEDWTPDTHRPRTRDPGQPPFRASDVVRSRDLRDTSASEPA